MFEQLRKWLHRGPRTSVVEESRQLAHRRFGANAQHAVYLAGQEAIRLGHTTIRPEHLWLGVLKIDTGVTPDVMAQLVVDPQALVEEAQALAGQRERPVVKEDQLRFAPEALGILKQSLTEAQWFGDGDASPADLLLALLRRGGRVADSFVRQGTSYSGTRRVVRRLYREQTADRRSSVTKPKARMNRHPSDAYLEKMCREGALHHYPNGLPLFMEHRLLHELSIIGRLGLTEYFLIAWDITNFARSDGMLVGPGRGSSASLVAYLLGITNLDPSRYGLIFEQFVNPDRKSKLKFEIDVSEADRSRLDDYVRRKYGENPMAKVITVKSQEALTVVQKVLHLIEAKSGAAVANALALENIPLDDVKTFQLLESQAVGVFHLDSTGMRDLLRKLRPTEIEDIIALISLYRPGPMKAGMVDKYIHRKHGREKVRYDHPLLEPILKNTHGMILYEEQILLIALVLGRFTPGQAKRLFKVMQRKRVKEMDEPRAAFVIGARKRGVHAKTARKIFDHMEESSRYVFSRAHAVAYGLLAYQTGYLKANFPAEYMTGLLSTVKDDPARTAAYRTEAREMGIPIDLSS